MELAAENTEKASRIQRKFVLGKDVFPQVPVFILYARYRFSDPEKSLN